MANQVAYGFHNLLTIFDRRILDTQVSVIETALAASLAEHNRQMDATLDLFCTRITLPKERYKVPAVARLQPVDDQGRATPILGGAQYDVGYPLRRAGLAWGTNVITREKMTVADVNEITNTFLMADIRWLRDNLLSALFSATDWTYQDEKYGDIVVKTLARGEAGYIYPIIAGADQGALDTHLLGFNNPIATLTDPFPAAITELREHPENGEGQIIFFVPTASRAAIEGLASFVPLGDPAIQQGSDSDRLVETFGTAIPGELFGYHRSKAYFAEWKILPTNYIIGTVAGANAPLGLREEEEASLRGFRQIGERNDHPYWERQWYRAAGFGARNRVGALVIQLSSATYATPSVGSSSYQAPLGS